MSGQKLQIITSRIQFCSPERRSAKPADVGRNPIFRYKTISPVPVRYQFLISPPDISNVRSRSEEKHDNTHRMSKFVCFLALMALASAAAQQRQTQPSFQPGAPAHLGTPPNFAGPLPVRRARNGEADGAPEAPTGVEEKDDMDKAETFGFGYHHYYPSYGYGYGGYGYGGYGGYAGYGGYGYGGYPYAYSYGAYPYGYGY
uniref:Uncharacterized protein n=1 Tax=Anopheles atroparvus TaxID=41427 RepID=A0A182IZU9_ANOAO